MRLAENSDNYRASNIIRKVVEVPDEPRRPRKSRAGRDKFCGKNPNKGEHEWEEVDCQVFGTFDSNPEPAAAFYQWRCTKCRKNASRWLNISTGEF